MDWFNATIPTSNIQSVLQLGTAIALAYLVAGPQVLQVVLSRFITLERLGLTVEALIENGGMSTPAMHARRQLLTLTDRLLRNKAAELMPVRSATTVIYIASAAAFFLALGYATFFTQIWTWVMVLLYLAVIAVMLQDGLHAWRASRDLQVFADTIVRIARLAPSEPAETTPDSPVSVAIRVVSDTLLGRLDLIRAQSQLVAIER